MAKPQPAQRPNHRTGPRPLALHMALQTLVWLSSRAALTQLNGGSLPWRPELKAAAESLERELGKRRRNAGPEAFEKAVEGESRRRLAAFADGVRAYRHHAAHRTLADPPVVWSEGTTRLLDYGATAAKGKKGRPLLVVPSLVNRAYVLDLTRERSFVRHLASRGFRPFLVDWDAPGSEERTFTLSDYIAGRLRRALEAAVQMSAGPVGVVGYCMGGNLVLPLAERHPEMIGALALLATPWNFEAMKAANTQMLRAAKPQLETLIDSTGNLPVDVLQSMFAGLDPYLAVRKFQRFAAMDKRSRKARKFVALEDWLNDGIPLVGAVARECLFGWYGENTPARGRWKIEGRPVVPRRVRAPALVVVPEQDYIVPPASARPLAEQIPGAECWSLAAGHIGMATGGRAPEILYDPLARWLTRVMA